MMVLMDMEGAVAADGTSTADSEDGDIDSLEVGGDLTGSVSAMGSGTIGSFNVGGSVGVDGSVEAEEITTMMVSMNMEGTITADGTSTTNPEDGDIDSLTIGGDLTGSVSAMGSGTIGSFNVGGSVGVDGSVEAEEITTMMVSMNMEGTITADGTSTTNPEDGDIDSLTIGGDLTGSVSAMGSGTIGSFNVGGSVGTAGSVEAEEITTMMVSMNMEGTITADGTSTTMNPDDGDIDSLTIGGDLTGSVSAMGSGTIGSFNVGGSVGTAGSVEAEEITTMMVSMNMEGTITADGTSTTMNPDDGDIDSLTIGGDLTGSVSAMGSGTIGSFNVGGSVGTAGSVEAEEITTMMVSMNMEGTITADCTSTMNPDDGDIDCLAVGGDLTGSVSAMGSGTIGDFNIGGSVGVDGSVEAEEITTMMVSMNMEGTVMADGTVDDQSRGWGHRQHDDWRRSDGLGLGNGFWHDRGLQHRRFGGRGRIGGGRGDYDDDGLDEHGGNRHG